jgi:hypothetical protein
MKSSALRKESLAQAGKQLENQLASDADALAKDFNVDQSIDGSLETQGGGYLSPKPVSTSQLRLENFKPYPNSLARGRDQMSGVMDYEVLTSEELAERLKVPESWIVEQGKRSRTSDPIPVFRLGKHRRYRWGSPEMNAWLERRAGHTTRKAGSTKTRNGGNE